MLTTASLTLVLAVSVVLGGPTIGRHRHFDANKTETAEKIAATAVKVYWHVISKDSTLAGGNIPDSQIANQISVLNKNYAANNTWTLGGKGVLNVYSVGFVSGSGAGLLGYSTFPSSYSGAPQDDGIVILFSSVPCGSTTGYNLGRTLTYMNQATGSGCDYVADTPAESSATSGCPSGYDTCTRTELLGADPVTNFMDYCDACMTQFSTGQMTRATTQSATYRT
ncbi:hypothetical protein B0H17DRAFT_1191464 [Mycena rosella]|uniref:Uncharacterized protein n=1 Tax=Mycena rosella TaxID=1033263 RepID=A0AAD7GZR3_MYCRO|nr:hypothetical protein B0H17DRAFT_1191464 [Mycena rosella]